MVHDRAEAEDLLQEVFTAAWRRADTFDAARGGAMTWLVTLARNRAIDRLRQHHESPLDDAVAHAIADDDPTPAARAEASEERQRLERCMAQLEPTQRAARSAKRFSAARLTANWRRPERAARHAESWIRRSLMQLKSCLES
jgi:RNA polymerase sigma-70 factor (ECF subfamily)